MGLNLGTTPEAPAPQRRSLFFMVTVHRFKLADPTTGGWSVQLIKCTEQRIAQMGGRIIAHTAEQVDPSLIDSEGRYIPAR
jgi:hypothetical protein